MKITFLLNPETNWLDWLQVFEPLLRSLTEVDL